MKADTFNNKAFTWIPFYMEFAKALLKFKDDRRLLVDFMYSELSKVGGKSLVDYLHMEDGSKVKDIDPFSVFAIFNRSLKRENRIGFLQKIKDRFDLGSDVPTDFDGVPTVNSQRAFFFDWAEKNATSIQNLWEIFEGCVLEKDISQQFDKIVNKWVSQYSLTIILYWIAPYRFINLDGTNRSYLNTLGLPDNYPNLNYTKYTGIIEKVQSMMNEHIIPASTFPEVSNFARSMAQTEKIWMYKRDEGVFDRDYIGMGSSAKGMLDFTSFKSKKTLGDAYRKIVGNTDVSIPDMYWKMMKEVKEGDIVVVFDSTKAGRTYNHLLYGWGRITSDVFYDKQDANPIHRKVEWHMPIPLHPIKETKTNNTRYFHDVTGIEAANIIKLLDIKKEGEQTMQQTNYDRYIQLLISNKNLILTGAPGTGKTFMAKAIAEKMEAEIGFVQFHPSYDYTDFVEGLKPVQRITSENISFERKDGVFKRFCKDAMFTHRVFYKLYDEIAKDISLGKLNFDTDKYQYKVRFVDNNRRITIKKVNDETNHEQKKGLNFEKIRVVFEYFMTNPEEWPSKCTKDGFNDIIAKSDIEGKYVEFYIRPIIEELWKRAKKEKRIMTDKKFVFIIDEINRGEVSKIFGEVFFSIDPGYRGEQGKVYTQYQNLILDDDDDFKDGFYVPENVYIIGTMNDIDRSVESMDFAMRRRFAWAEVTAEESMQMLNGIANETEIKTRMRNLNNAILKVRGLSEAYQIGAAYFKKIEDYNGDFQKLWDFHLKGLLYEYMRGNMNAEEQLEELKKAYDSNAPIDGADDSNQG